MVFNEHRLNRDDKRPTQTDPRDPPDKPPGWMWGVVCIILLISVFAVCGLGDCVRNTNAIDAGARGAARDR